VVGESVRRDDGRQAAAATCRKACVNTLTPLPGGQHCDGDDRSEINNSGLTRCFATIPDSQLNSLDVRLRQQPGVRERTTGTVHFAEVSGHCVDESRCGALDVSNGLDL